MQPAADTHGLSSAKRNAERPRLNRLDSYGRIKIWVQFSARLKFTRQSEWGSMVCEVMELQWRRPERTAEFRELHRETSRIQHKHTKSAHEIDPPSVRSTLTGTHGTITRLLPKKLWSKTSTLKLTFSSRTPRSNYFFSPLPIHWIKNVTFNPISFGWHYGALCKSPGSAGKTNCPAKTQIKNDTNDLHTVAAMTTASLSTVNSYRWLPPGQNGNIPAPAWMISL